jgi:hypothetical protein
VSAESAISANAVATFNSGATSAGASSISAAAGYVLRSGAAVSITSAVVVIGREKWETIAEASSTWTDIPQGGETWTKLAA